MVGKISKYVGTRHLYVESRIPEVKKHRVPVVFLHGSFAGSWSWEHYLDYFSLRGWECHAPNLRGHYRSAPTDLGKVHFVDLVEDVREVVGPLGNEVVFVATSSGGIITQKHIEANSATAAVLLNSIPPKSITLPWVNSASIEAMPAIIEIEREPKQTDLPDIPLENFARFSSLFGKESGTAAREWRAGIKIDPLKVSCPVLVVGSQFDTRITPSISEKIAQYYHADYLYFEGVSHLGILFGHKWEQVASGVHQWLEKQGL